MPTCSRIRSLFKVCKCNSPVLEALELTLQTLHRAGMAGGCKFAVWYSPADRVSETLQGWVKSVQVSETPVLIRLSGANETARAAVSHVAGEGKSHEFTCDIRSLPWRAAGCRPVPAGPQEAVPGDQEHPCYSDGDSGVALAKGDSAAHCAVLPLVELPIPVC